MKLAASLCMVFLACTLTSFHASNQKRTPNETISAYVSSLTGSNDVGVMLSRTGPDAGACDVCFDIYFSFNDGSCQPVHFCMSQGETSRQDHVQGPNPTAFAYECYDGAAFNIVYGGNCPY